MIPKIIHYCWYGAPIVTNTMAYRCRNSWSHLGGKLIEWNEDNCPCNENDFIRSAKAKKQYAFMSDYYRLKALYGTGDIMKFLSSNFVSYDSSSLKLVRKELTTFRENNKDKLILVRNKIAAHRDSDVCEQIGTIEGLHLSEAVSLITEYGRIINKLGVVTSPLKALGIKRLEATK